MCKLKSAVTEVKSQINSQLELLSMIDRQDFKIASIFHLLVESMLANAFLITVVCKYGIIII